MTLALTLAAWSSHARAETGGDTGCTTDLSLAECDRDADGHLSLYCCGDDCNDGDPGVNPEIEEPLDSKEDLDCDGIVWSGDEGQDPLYLSGGSGACTTAPDGSGAVALALLFAVTLWRSRCARSSS